MGYACPVCGDPQADDIHLANHLAFTALARGGDHEAWLDEHVPEWDQYDDDGLAAAVTDLAEQTEYPQVFEDTTGGHDHTHDSGHQHDAQTDLSGMGVDSSEMLDEDAREALAEAREMTRKRRESNEASEQSDTDPPDAAADSETE
jgi:hypothetical protein